MLLDHATDAQAFHDIGANSYDFHGCSPHHQVL
jgi:hypothetical protein